MSQEPRVPPPPPPSATRPSSGLITFVPGITKVAPSAGPVPAGPVPTPEPPAAQTPEPPMVDRVPVALRRAAVDDGVGRTPDPDDLDDLDDLEDIESTRLAVDRDVRIASARPVAVAAAALDAVPSAVLHLWDGRRLTLTGTALMGRGPTPRDGEPVPTHRLTLDDPTRSVSKTHLAVGVDSRGVWVLDRGSTNGTVVTVDGTAEECPPHAEVRVPPGATVAFGRYWFTVT